MKTQGKSVYESSDKQEIRDSLYELLLPVTQEHIQQAEAAKRLGLPLHETCPLALALRARVPSAFAFRVGVYTAGFEVNGVRFLYDLPKDARAFTAQFDYDEPVKPELFRLRLLR